MVLVEQLSYGVIAEANKFERWEGGDFDFAALAQGGELSINDCLKGDTDR